MIIKLRQIVFLLTLLLTTTFTSILSFSESIGNIPALESQPVVLQKSSEILSIEARDYLSKRNIETAAVWIFFSDKGVFNQTDFAFQADKISFSEKVLKRRAKVNKDKVVFADLPVVTEYVDQITNTGGKLRRISKWLNAASFEIPMTQLEQISAFPFVISIKPIAGFKHAPENIEDNQMDNPDKNAEFLNYGFAQTQLEQINVPPVHVKGYSGQGVTLAIFDTGFRKSHEAFAMHYLQGRVLAEYDFVFNDSNTANEAEDWSSQWNHGTYIWSVSGGYKDGSIYGPAYKANFILCKTEDIRSETPVEEDNWVAALEWVEPLGADVVTSSLGYSDWYNSSDMDGNTAITTLAANTAAGLGIVVCNSMGNSGPNPTTLSAPADAFDILAIGAVNSSGNLASFSSRGPTFDGRTKPEVCAMGVSTACATSSSDNSYSTASGTSLSTPLIAGAACLLIEARPNFNPYLIRLALMETADNAATPNNDYGWGIIDLDASLGWGANFVADITVADAPITVQFTDLSSLTVNSWAWSFGDGDSAFIQNPVHTYANTGAYDVSLSIDTEYGIIAKEKSGYIIALGDTSTFVSDSAFAGDPIAISVEIINSQPLDRIDIPIQFYDSPKIVFDSASRGARTGYFENLEAIAWDPWNSKFTYRLIADNGGGSPPLSPGSGEIMKLHFTIDPYELGGLSYPIDTSLQPFSLKFASEFVEYTPVVFTGSVITTTVIRGDVDYTQQIDIADLVQMVDFSFNDGPEPVTIQSFDVNADLSMDIEDLTYMVDYMFNFGPPPVSP